MGKEIKSEKLEGILNNGFIELDDRGEFVIYAKGSKRKMYVPFIDELIECPNEPDYFVGEK